MSSAIPPQKLRLGAAPLSDEGQQSMQRLVAHQLFEHPGSTCAIERSDPIDAQTNLAWVSLRDIS
eukprot:3581326-Pyramimonas_sp.AAC.2